MNSHSIFWFFWQHIKPYKWFYFLMMLAPLVSSFFPFAYNYAIKLFLDVMTAQDPCLYSDLVLPICLFITSQFALDFVWRLSDVASWKSEPYVRQSILLNSYDYVQSHAYPFFQENFTGAISSKLKGILDGYDKFWAEMHHGVFARFLKILVNFSALAFVNWHLGLLVVLWSAVYLPVMYTLSLRLHQLSFEETESRHELIGQIADKITNILSLFSFASRKREFKNLDQLIQKKFIPRQIRSYHYYFFIQIVAGILYMFLFVFMLFYMIYLRMDHLISIGDFAFVFGIAHVVAEDIWHVTTSLQEFARTMGDLQSALTVLYVPHQNQDRPHARSLKVVHPQIEFKNITFGYDLTSPLFIDLNLSIRPGEKIGLVGKSGSGKSSLINLLLRYFQQNSGDILIDGQNILEITQDSLRENIGVIPQDTLLFHRSVMENIRYGKVGATDEEVIEASKNAHIHEFIMRLPQQYQTPVGERGVKLSGGQRQRIAIARAILKNAPILILDEATSALDSQTEKLIQESLQFLMEGKGKTVIAIAHRLSTLKHMDRIIVLDKGNIVEQGKHHALIRNPNSLYKKLWEIQEMHTQETPNTLST